MIKVENLSKRYTSVFAVDNISFNVPGGEILGFLGPNGAGKSTTMKIITCFMPATSGSVRVGGFDVFNDSIKARRIIGYLPENVPLYTDMRVNEYLLFRSKIKDVPRRERKSKIGECLDLCGIVNVQDQIIGTLSKGYRQRVGLADTLVHDPKVLILDEPTIGLDPNQIRQVRGIIKNLGEKRTVLISTHILPEVEMLCNRVIIINKGKIAAEDTPANLLDIVTASSNLSLEIKGDSKKVEDVLKTIDDVEYVSNRITAKRDLQKETILPNTSSNDEVNIFDIECKKGVDAREKIFNAMVQNKFIILEMKKRAASLEDIFYHITTKEEEVK